MKCRIFDRAEAVCRWSAPQFDKRDPPGTDLRKLRLQGYDSWPQSHVRQFEPLHEYPRAAQFPPARRVTTSLAKRWTSRRSRREKWCRCARPQIAPYVFGVRQFISDKRNPLRDLRLGISCLNWRQECFFVDSVEAVR